MGRKTRTRGLAVLFSALCLLFILYRVNMAADGGLFSGALMIVFVVFLIAVSLRASHTNLAALRRRGPKYDPRDRLRAERERMLNRTVDDPPQEEHK